MPPIPPRRRAPGRTPGFAWLHVVDLNGAFAGHPVNADGGRRRSSAAVTLPVQLGGGIRDLAAHRGLAGRRRAPRHPRQRRGEEPATGDAAPAAPFPAASPSASTRATASSPPRAGRRPRRCPPLDLALPLRGCRRGGDHLHRHRPRRHAVRAQPGADRRAGARRSTTPVIASGGVGGLPDLAALRDAAEGTPHRGGDRRPRAVRRPHRSGRGAGAAFRLTAAHMRGMPDHSASSSAPLRRCAPALRQNACHGHAAPIVRLMPC